MRWRQPVIAALVVGLLAPVTTGEALGAEPPVNDHATGAVVLSVPGAYEQSTEGATVADEPAMACGSGGATVWFRLPAHDDAVVLTTRGSDFDTVMEVRSLDGATVIACDDDSGGSGTSALRLVPSDEEVLVRVGGYDADTGYLRLAAEAPRPTVDIELPFAADGELRRDDSPAGYHCAYGPSTPVYQLVADRDFMTSITALLETDYMGLSIVAHRVDGDVQRWCHGYANGGAAVEEKISMVAGQTYEILAWGLDEDWRVDTSGSYFSIAVEEVPPPDHDEIDAARPVAVGDVVEGWTWGATRGATEPRRCGADRSVWHRLDAADSGQVHLDTGGSEFDTVVAVHRLEDDGSLAQVACNDDLGGSLQAQVAFDAVAGESYLIQLGGFDGQMGDYRLEVTSAVWVDGRQLLVGGPSGGVKGDEAGVCMTSRFVPSTCVFTWSGGVLVAAPSGAVASKG